MDEYYYALCLKPRVKFPIVSWLIRFFQGNLEYSHMAIQVGMFIVDSTSHGVKIYNLEEFSSKYKLVKKYKIKSEKKIDLISWVDKYDESNYPEVQNVGLLLKYLKLIDVNPFGKNDEDLICAELCLVFLRDHNNFILGDSDEYDLIQAEDIFRRFSC